MYKVRNDQASKKRLPGREATSLETGAVVQLAHPPKNPLPCSGADVQVMIEDLGHRDHGNSQVLGDILHANCHGFLTPFLR
jgi:hypothetical protein